MHSQPYLANTSTHIAQKVRRIISRRKDIKLQRLQFTSTFRELNFDLVDVVDIILELERSFHLTIPDEVPLHTIGDFVYCVANYHAADQQKAA
ncbi:phosphopantetheine-binding protein [Hymenobacter tibetensis]|uniref:Phosphopantetheine-binding protein n=1 Tax=Hymenobacter tibetensis TaxID=497967 RepID=A0ABY4CS23_9BACT|nr:phosphopantetheine-binding protein [Hymenobacter tibetensis]UOG73053.1 phosphopantetheine-binding protein [Hymenobacter tibetensis]